MKKLFILALIIAATTGVSACKKIKDAGDAATYGNSKPSYTYTGKMNTKVRGE